MALGVENYESRRILRKLATEPTHLALLLRDALAHLVSLRLDLVHESECYEVGGSVCASRTPKRSSSLDAASYTIDENSRSRPTGVPF